MSLSGRGRLLTELSLCLPTRCRICNLQRCCSGRGDTVEAEGDGVVGSCAAAGVIEHVARLRDFLLTGSHSSRPSSSSRSLLHGWT